LIGEKLASKHAFGYKAYSRFGANRLLESDLVSDGLADFLAQLIRDSPRCQSRGDAPRFDYDDLPTTALAKSSQQRRRYSRRFAGARRGFYDDVGVAAKRRDDLRQKYIDRENRLAIHDVTIEARPPCQVNRAQAERKQRHAS
jgi:hypothetical protein